jgi:hypothetical protein
VYGKDPLNPAGWQADAFVAAARAAAYTLEQLAILLDSRAGSQSPEPDDHAERWEALREENRQLREALDSRSSIERAKGLLMGRYGYTEQQAFALLVSAARHQQRKARLIANDLLVGVHLPEIEQAVHLKPEHQAQGAPQTERM